MGTRRSSKRAESKTRLGARILERLTDFAEALEAEGAIPQRFNRRRVILDLQPAPYGPNLVRQTRILLGASQAVFAQFLGASVKAVRAWEQGVNAPNEMACRFMDEIRRNPKYWRDRLCQSVVSRATFMQGAVGVVTD